MVSKLPRGHLAATAYEHVKARLLDGKHRAGERLSPDAIVQAVGASRQPVMEALKRLASEGFLEIVPQVGCRVVIPEQREITDFFRLFAATEGLCAELAAQRGSADELAQLERVIAKVDLGARTASAAERARRYRLHNREFHAHVHVMAHSQTLHGLARVMWDRADFFINNAIGSVPFITRLPDALDEHRDVVAAVSRRDGSLARRRMEEHVFAFALAMERAPSSNATAARTRKPP